MTALSIPTLLPTPLRWALSLFVALGCSACATNTENATPPLALQAVEHELAEYPLPSDIRLASPSHVDTLFSKGVEALCAGKIGAYYHMINVDAENMLHHYEWRGNTPTLLRSFAIGPGIKSCAITEAENTQLKSATLYLADEFSGLWAMPLHPEHEVSKSLQFYQPDTPVEGVATGYSHATGPLVAWVSPAHSGVWLQTQCARHYFSFDKDIAPELVRFSSPDSPDTPVPMLYVNDDETGAVYAASLTDKLSACDAPAASSQSTAIPLLAVYETTPVDNYGDAADDPAIWYNSQSPAQSLIIGTDKKGALNTYSLQGKRMASHPIGKVNNVEVVAISSAGVTPTGSPINALAIASNRTHNSLSVLSVAQGSGELALLSDIPTPLSDIYGLCAFNHNGNIDVLVNSTSGEYLRYQLSLNPDSGNIDASMVHAFTLPSQPEGCVVDTQKGVAYLGEESTGVWTLDVNQTQASPQLAITITAPVESDVEGLSLFDVDGVRYLIASSQGNNQYAVYSTDHTFSLIGMVEVTANREKSIDGASETDGLATSNYNFGGEFSEGIFVVQDGRNIMPSEKQNFKIVTGTSLANAIRSLNAAN